MKTPRNGAASFHFKKTGLIYVFGGSNSAERCLDSIERYSVISNNWTLLDLRLPIPIHNF